VNTSYLGMELAVDDSDQPNREYFRRCAAHEFALQRCADCDLVRYPPTTACPMCGGRDAHWSRIDARGSIYSYTEVRHAIQAGFRPHAPYLVLLVELDVQRGLPTADDALRIVGNLVTAGGQLVSAEDARGVGIGSRVRMAFTDVAADLSLPQWTLDESVEQPQSRWRYPES
jgi:uncharacterized protein